MRRNSLLGFGLLATLRSTKTYIIKENTINYVENVREGKVQKKKEG